MSRQALNGISQVIKANTTEKSIDDLRAEGKKRVRVVSSERVMTIIQAIVDDTIASEVGEITKRDRDRIVGDTQERFSRVLKMQQDLEQQLDDLRGSLRDTEVERDRLRGEKTLLEAQLEAARVAEGGEDAAARLTREMARVRDALERTAREPGTVDEAALVRVAEKISARETQNARRLAADLEEIRSRLDAVVREAATARESAAEKLVQRLNVRLCESDAHLEERLERGFKEVAGHVAQIRGQIGRAPAADDAVAKLRSDFGALESRIHGVAKSSSDEAERVAKTVIDWLRDRDAAEAARRKAEAAGEASQVAESVRRVQRASEETRESILRELSLLRDAADGAGDGPVSIESAQLREIEERLAAAASEATDAVARAVDRVAGRIESLETSIQEMRGDDGAAEATGALAKVVGRVAERVESLDASLQAVRADDRASEAVSALARTVERIDERMAALDASLEAMRREVAEAADRTPVFDTTASQAEAAARLDGALAELRAELATVTSRGAEAAGRQEAAIRALGEQVALGAAVQSGSLETTFKGALEQALDKITRTMERATARPIEMTGEATDVLLAKMFDVPDGEMTSNLDQLDVEQRRSKATIGKSVGRLKEMNGRQKPAGK